MTIENLWTVAERLAATREESFAGVLGVVGLILERPLKRWEYWCTPRNTLTFAGTGCDGVHYGLLQLPGLSSHPIVMTIPMANEHNLVVAEDLAEFLNLGYYVGWSSLDELVYRAEEAVAHDGAADPNGWAEEEEILAVLRRELKLRHEPLSLSRIDSLRSKYGELLKVRSKPDNSEWGA